MGTSSEGRRGGDEEGDEIIPWKFVPYEVTQKLIKNLNPDMTMSGNDWRGLAANLGYSTSDINFIESDKDNNTKLLFQNYSSKAGASFSEVYRSLERMERHDCIDILNDALPGIREAFRQGGQESMAERSEMPLSGHYMWCGPSYPYSFPSHAPSSVCGSHPFHPCSHHYPTFPGPAPAHSHHPTSCQALCHPHPAHPSYPGCGHSPTQENMCHSGFPSSPVHAHSQSYHGNAGGSSSPCCLRQVPTTNRSLSENYGYGSSSPRGQANMGSTGLDLRSPPVYNYSHSVPLTSMSVESDPKSLSGRPMPSLQSSPTLFGNRSAGMEHSDIPAAVPQTLLRSQQSLPNNICPFDNSNLTSISSSQEDSMSLRQKIPRQYSDEHNTPQNFSGDKRPRHNDNIRDWGPGASSGYSHPAGSHSPEIGAQGHLIRGQGLPDFNFTKPLTVDSDMMKPRHNPAARQFSTGSDSYGDVHFQEDVKPQNISMRHSGRDSHRPTDLTVSGSRDHQRPENSLASLEQLSSATDRFMPTQDYQTYIAEQKIEDSKSSKAGKNSGDSASTHSSSSGSSSCRSGPSSTYPKRSRRTQDKGVENLAGLTISQKQKSVSVPNDMKPAQYRKAFRSTKVFVTYSFDSEAHGKQVLSLCKFLQDNGFTCCVDVTEKENEAQSLIDWCCKKVSKADFVLACISRQYLQDISSTGQPFAPQQNTTRRLHAKEILEFMNRQHSNGQEENDDSNSCEGAAAHGPRFVPLLFREMEEMAVPTCMREGPVYRWPEQYMDLAWLLTKPQERLQGRRT